MNLARIALAILALAQGRYDDAVVAGPSVARRRHPASLHVGAPRARRSSRMLRRRPARDARPRPIGVARGASGTTWALGLRAGSRALLAADDSAADHYEEAIEHLPRTPVCMDPARAYLIYGEWWRRSHRTTDAPPQLRAAFDHFEEMGANAFAERARQELAAAGERASRPSRPDSSELTAQEA
jgi:hypothetical protein